MGFLEGLIIFILSHYWYCKNNSDGLTNDFYAVGTIILSGVIVMANLKVYLDMNFIDYFSLTLLILSVLLYFISILIFSNDYIFPGKMIKNFYILDNFINVICDLKFVFYIILVSSFCYFLEIFAEKAPILYGLVIEGKYLPPYQKARTNSKNFEFEIIEKEELETYFSQSMAGQRNQNQDEEEEQLILT